MRWSAAKRLLLPKAFTLPKMKYTTTSAPVWEPITLTEAKAQLRVDGSDEDTLISDLISVAREKFEDVTGRALVVRDITAYWDTWPSENELALPVYPALGVSHVTYLDENGASQTWDGTNYTADTIGQSPRIVLNTNGGEIPELGDYPNALRVLYPAGSSEVPASAKQAMLLMLTMLYEQRSDMPLKDQAAGSRSAQWLAFNHRKDLI